MDEFKWAKHRDETMDFAAEIKADEVHHNGFFKGYASTFGGSPDRGGDVIAKGCFNRTLKEKGRDGAGIAMLWSHDPRCPIGAWQILREDEKGLYVEGIIEPTACPDGVPVHKIMKMGGIKGLSIGYNTVLAETDDKKKVRTLKDVDLWEISLVTFPMNTRASVTSVKNILEAKNERELEDALREAGLSREASKYLVKLAKAGLREAGPKSIANTETSMDPILSELKKLNRELSIQGISTAIQSNF